MFCIAAFIILGLLSIFSASQRKLARSAWSCVARKVTFRPCNTDFKTELKSKLLAPVAVKHPKYLKHVDRSLEIGAFVLVTLSIWSLVVVLRSGLFLYVYGTCKPNNASGCSLGAEACSIDSAKPGFWNSVTEGRPDKWINSEWQTTIDAVKDIPTRMQDWEATDYISQNSTYYNSFDANKNTALEIIDPSCQYCAQLFRNIKDAKFNEKYNIAYVVYPIKDSTTASGYKFEKSLMLSEYLEAIKSNPLQGSDRPVDWKIIERIFSQYDQKNTLMQTKINTLMNKNDVEIMLQDWLKEFGYSDQQIEHIVEFSKSNEVSKVIEANREIVDKKIKTKKIPTIIYDGKRHSGVVKTEDLK